MAETIITSALDEYVQQTILLTRSIVFKSSVSAERLNNDIIRVYGEDAVDPSYPETWKYYLNISGQYHFSDQIMTVISLDTQQVIDYTVENLALHTATAEAYRYGTRYYFALVRRFPEQQQLIMAINNPADIQTAIDAEDGRILAYYKHLVEYQEDTLIYELENYIKNYLQRYTVVGYQNVVKNYPVINYAGLNQSLPGQIMNLRLEAAKTERAHSFHITQYLGSHGYLDRFIPYMTLKQKLYLYHNIDFIEKYAGHTDTFEELIQWILNDRYIPLASYTVRQLQEHNAQLYPELRARRSPLGTLANTAEAEYIPITALYEKEKPLQPGNPDYYKYHEARITHSLETDDTSVIQTKDLESAMVDYTDAVPDPLPVVLLRQWAYMSASGLYDVLTNFTHPTTGDRISIMSSDALIYYSYIFMKAVDCEPEYVPNFLDIKFRLHPKPPVSLLYRDLVKDDFPDLKAIADKLIADQPMITRCYSVSAFFNLNYKIYEQAQKHWILTSNTHDPMKRGIIAKMISRLYGIKNLILSPTQIKMKDWLVSKSLPEFTGTYQDSLVLTKLIFEASTGYSIDETKTLRSIQRAMIEIFKQLSSYTIQVMREINDSAIVPVAGPAIRVGFRGQEMADDHQIPVGVRVIDTIEKSEDYVDVKLPKAYVDVEVPEMTQNSKIEVDVKVNLCSGIHSSMSSVDITIPRLMVYETATSKADVYKPFFPNAYYEQLTEAQKLEIANQINLQG